MPPPVQVSKFANIAKLGDHTKISTRAVGTSMRLKRRHTEGLELSCANFATNAMHISQRARGTRAYHDHERATECSGEYYMKMKYKVEIISFRQQGIFTN